MSSLGISDASLLREDTFATPSLEHSDTVPICVDLDGTLIFSDLLGESLAILLARKPWLIFAVPFWLLKGRAALKRQIARRVKITPSLLPYDEDLLAWITSEKALGRRLILATAADRDAAQNVADHLGLFEKVVGSDGHENCKGTAKLKQLRRHLGVKFDYAGNSRADLPIWKECREAVVAHATPGVLSKARRGARVVRVFEPKRGVLKLWAKCLRVHQWSKNLLIFVPLITSHRLGEWALLRSACLSFLAFSLCASGVYILNDIVDLEADRQHAVKRDRPFACGGVSVLTGLSLAPVLMGAGLAISFLLPIESLYVLLVYLTLTFAYSVWLKRLLLVDVFALAALYSIRLIAGRASYSVELSSWLLSFSMFLFLSLGFCKRASELCNLRRQNYEFAPGRNYLTSDLDQINLFGVVSGFLASLVLTLYLQSGYVRSLYKQPQLLWLLFPLLLFWITRIWILSSRGQMNEDPVLFAIKDKATWAVGLSAAGILLVASHLWIS